MGNLFGSSKKEKKQERRRPTQNTVSIDQKDTVLAKMMVQRDRYNAKVKKHQQDEEMYLKKALGLKRKGEKDQAMWNLRKVKRLRDHRKGLMKRLDFAERQISSIESAMDDVEFTNSLKQSNKVLAKLNEEIDLEEIRIAKDLQEEGKIRSQELNDLLDEDEDEDLIKELNEIEAGIMKEEFDNNQIDTGAQQQQQHEVMEEKREAMLA